MRNFYRINDICFKQVIGAQGADFSRVLAIGGDGELEPGVSEPRANRFEPVVRHLGPFELAAGRKATHRLNLPNYVGAVRVMVVAAGALHIVVSLLLGRSGIAIGASGATLGLLIACATLSPHRTIYLLVFPIKIWVVAAAITVFNVFPVLVGQFIESRPMAVMYLTLGIVLFCVGLFALAAVAGRVYKRTAPKDEKAVAREEEENQPLKA